MDITISVGCRVAIIPSKYAAEPTDHCGGTVIEVNRTGTDALVRIDGGMGEFWFVGQRLMTQARERHNAEIRGLSF